MARERDNLRFSSGPIVKISSGLVVAAVLGLLVTVVVTGANGIAVALLVTVGLAGLTGLVLERIDSTRGPRRGEEREHDEHWGYHGRPGR